MRVALQGAPAGNRRATARIAHGARQTERVINLRTLPDAIDHLAALGAPSLVGRGFTALLERYVVRTRRFASPAGHRLRGRSGLVLACTLALSLSFGCGTFVRSTYVNDPPRPLTPVAAQNVEVFVSGPPQRDYVDVALLEVEQTQSINRTGTDYMIEKLRRAAGKMGCDAVVLAGASEHSRDPDALFDEDSKTLIASCIVYTGPEHAAESVPALTSVPSRTDAAP